MGLGVWLRERWRRDAAAAEADPRDLLLAALPVVVGVVGASLLFPRAVVPVRVPLPTVDGRVLEAEARADEARVAQVAREPLSASVREVGGAFRAWNLLAFRDDDEVVTEAHQRATKLGALARSVVEQGGTDALLALRAIETRSFVEELHRFAATSVESDELRALGGNVVARMRDVGWIDGTHLVLADRTWRVLYRALWNNALGVSATPAFALSLDDEREIARIQFTHPHPSETERLIVAAERVQAKTPEACDVIVRHEIEAADRWRLQKVESWAARDPAYPRDFARGVLLFRLGRFAEAARAFHASGEAGGAYAERAFFHERAALVATSVE
jgi:hypothetical protein